MKPTQTNHISTINFHILEACNFGCRFCYATHLSEAERTRQPSLEQARAVIRAIADYNAAHPETRIRRINFAGGEPLLYRPLPEVIRYAKELGFEVSIITNGSLLTPQWLEKVRGALDMVGLSIDSLDPEVLRRSGRMLRRPNAHPFTEAELYSLAEAIHKEGIPLKVNTVVHRYNLHETLAPFIARVKAFRWKILQVTRISGQNDSDYAKFCISDEEFHAYAERNKALLPSGVQVVVEPSSLIYGSYIMINPEGRLIEDISGQYRYSDPITEVGLAAAMGDIQLAPERFQARGGDYSLKKASLSPNLLASFLQPYSYFYAYYA